MDRDTREMFNAVIVEIDKLGEKMLNRFEKVDARIAKLDAKVDHVYERLTHEINACKLDRDVVNMLVDGVVEHDRRLDALEEKVF